MAAAVEKVLLYDGKPEKWMIQRRKFGAVFTRVGYNFVMKRAVKNALELVATGDAERDAWLNAEEGRVESQEQEYVYSTLVLAIVDALPEIVGKVDENSEECWTDLWNELLR
eukprot:3324037-Rhodomonas_salina.1